jgi:hypothetical protein
MKEQLIKEINILLEETNDENLLEIIKNLLMLQQD